ncbi:hypothetical protein [Trichococcus shcherbakoviae]|uniref:Uncharacterized protein n=1 Tax=Trichococcus shcherbakoviae TaxID=2094020 RepID=A0A383TEZ4_9LACT|nr:hypothetical protein [Trichococcus shcherbakoviae]SYZ78705.1 Hypothetical protein TART1_1490 [Trichococcus shcherbakoviae]
MMAQTVLMVREEVESKEITWNNPLTKRELKNYTREEIEVILTYFLTRKEEIERLNYVSDLLFEQVKQTRIRKSNQAYYCPLPTARMDEIVSFKADIKMSKYDMEYDFRLTSYDFIAHKYGQFQLTEEMTVYPLTFQMTDKRTGRTYNAISLTDKRFEKIFGGAFGNFFGTYFINGIGLCYFSVTSDDGVILKYIKGSGHKHTDVKYSYYSTFAHPQVNRTVRKVGLTAFGWNLMDEDLYYEPIDDFNKTAKKVKNPQKSKVKTLDQLVGALVI